ncbi:MAG: DUF4097 family beta strand repeat protein [Pricia sp.]|nr:DUF4097 family beta strand repeat protein [Pricia sp.]
MRYLILLLFSVNFLSAQKVVEKSFINPEIDAIAIDADHYFQLSVETALIDEMILEATIDGEYKKDLLLSVKEEGHTIFVSSGFQPNFRNPNDKLAAHKVISIALKVILPRNKFVKIYGTSCNVQVEGTYTNLEIILNDGKCTLNDVSGSVVVKTQSGDIAIKTGGAEISTYSKFGKIRKADIPSGTNKYSIQSTTGNISINKTE